MTVRVYELSKKYGVTNKELLQILQSKGVDVQSHMAALTSEAEKMIHDHFAPKAAKPSPVPPVPQEPKQEPKAAPLPQSNQGKAQAVMQQQVSQKKSKSKPSGSFQKRGPVRATPAHLLRRAEPIPEKIATGGVIIQAMSVGDFAEQSGLPVSDVILALMKQGVIAAKNQFINENVVAKLAQQLKVKIIEVPKPEPKEGLTRQPQAELPAGDYKERLPVVVVVGHVDHGKTTLLDYIRKTRVASREKGGITQHLGAYEAATEQGSVVFLDTPGHEAFTMMRGRGIKVADLAILVVAADDGIMPQTIEAINQAKLVGLPIMVALNKIDKATPAQIESVKRGLTQYDLTPEDWGGQTVVVPLSAKTGQGVNELLGLIVLQSQLLELKANMSIPARGFVLESRLEKGRGPVATVICQHGILHVGDHFVCGSMQGKVTSLVDSIGKRVEQVLPSQPVRVAGFSELPQAGDTFQVVTAAEAKKIKPADLKMQAQRIQPTKENALNLIIKTDNASSKEAVLNAIGKMSGKAFKEFNILNAGVGSITDGDVSLAIDTNSLIYGLHTKIEPSAAVESAKNNVSVKLFDIIYQMLDDLHQVAEQGRPVKKVLRKIGEATILKVFDIKNLGVIAGAQVRSGRFSKDGKVIIFRGKTKVGEGAIKSLQRDRKSVKEVHTGFECAFMVEGFTEWEIDDRVECYLEMAENA